MRITNEKLGVDLELENITQGQLEKFYIRLREMGGMDIEELTITEYSGNVVRVADEVGFINLREKVEEMKPAAVNFIQFEISKAIKDAMTIPPE